VIRWVKGYSKKGFSCVMIKLLVLLMCIGWAISATANANKSEVREEDPPNYAEKNIQWTGVIPYRKWMNFYTKVITKFASAPGLTLRVSLEAPSAGEGASTKVEDIKSALRELGLDADVKG